MFRAGCQPPNHGQNATSSCGVDLLGHGVGLYAPADRWGGQSWHTALVEQRHQDLLLSVYEAEARWSAQNGQQRTFTLSMKGRELGAHMHRRSQAC